MLMIRYFLIPIVLLFHESSLSKDLFIDSGQKLGNSNSWGISLVDLDGDGDLDAYFDNAIWYNNGNGKFQSSGKTLGNGDPKFSDFNGDGFTDAIVMDQVFLNDKKWNFIAVQNLGKGIIGSVTYDIDRDKDIDIITLYSNSDSLWYNDGAGHFVNTGKSFNGWSQSGYAFGDFDGDNDYDVFITIPHNPPPPPFDPKPDYLLLNTGDFNYEKSAQSFPAIMSRMVAVGDIDNDHDLDLLIGNQLSFIQLWINNGKGTFEQSQQVLSNTSTNEFFIDVDNDKDLDAFIIRGGPMDNGKTNELWLNQGGLYINSGLKLGESNSLSAAFGDIDNDGDVDIIIGNIDLKNNGAPNKVYLNMLNDIAEK
jgi:hypothetical protein